MRSPMFLLACGLLGLTHLPAQETGAQAPRTAFGLWHESGRLCGGGLGYRVEFGSAGTVYVPALPHAARSYPLRLALESVTRGGYDVGFVDDRKPFSDDAAVVDLDRGSLLERYALGPDGVEQSFVLRAPLPGRGDLVVRQRLTTGLVAEVHGDCSAGLVLRDPGGAGGVSIGRAIAVDARGDRTPLWMTFDGTCLEIRADSSLLEDAVYPLVLDPPIGTLRSIGGASGDVDPDVAWDETHQRYLAVWSRRLSARDSEVFGQLLDAGGQAVGPLVPVRTGAGTFAANPTVANVDLRDRFCVVWQDAPSPFGPFDLYCRTVEAGSAAVGNIVRVTSATANDVDPDVAGTLGTTARIVVVWQRAGDGIRSKAISIPVVGDPSSPTNSSSVQASADAEYPKITKSAGANDVPVVVWDGRNRVEGIALDLAGRPVGSRVVVAGLTLPAGKPDIAGDGRGGYFAVFERLELSNPVTDVYGRALRFDGTNLIIAGSEVAIEADQQDDEITPAVGYMAGKYLVACSDSGGVFLDYDIVMQAVSPEGVACGPRALARNDGGMFDAYPEIATQFSGGGTGDEAMVVFSALDNSSFATSIHGQRYEAFVGDGQVSPLGGGCGGGGAIDVTGPVAVGNIYFGLDLTGASAPDGTAFLFVALPGNTLACGPCSFVLPILDVPAPLRGGNARAPLPLPCSLEPAIGFRIVAQWITIGGAATPCPTFPSLAASDRLELTLGR